MCKLTLKKLSRKVLTIHSVLPNGLVSDTGMNSMNHYAYGTIVEWMYRYMCGINPTEEVPGFKKIILRPETDERLTWVEGEYLSASGLYKSSWKREGNKVIHNITIPFDAEADFVVSSDGKIKTINNEVVKAEIQSIILKAGNYEIVVQ